jgi:hypothetical protein
MIDNLETCCPQFNPEPWDGKQILWDAKKFVTDRVRSFLHIFYYTTCPKCAKRYGKNYVVLLAQI